MKKEFLSLSLLALAMVACQEPSADEKRERRENAFDISGRYEATAQLGSETPITMSIENKSGRSDILVRLQKSEDVTSKEREVLNAFGISESNFSRTVGSSLVLEAGNNANDAGGSNVSDDFGKTSKVDVETHRFNLATNTEGIYRLRGTLKKEDMKFRGELILEVTRSNPNDSSDYKFQEARMKITADSNAIFWTQYFGKWSGEVVVDDANLRGLDRLEIKKIDESNFQVLPASSTISYEGESYAFTSKNFPIERLSKSSSPLIEIEWKAASGKQIQLTASIWSLGELTGNFVLVDSNDAIPLGGFQFKKD